MIKWKVKGLVLDPPRQLSLKPLMVSQFPKVQVYHQSLNSVAQPEISSGRGWVWEFIYSIFLRLNLMAKWRLQSHWHKIITYFHFFFLPKSKAEYLSNHKQKWLEISRENFTFFTTIVRAKSIYPQLFFVSIAFCFILSFYESVSDVPRAQKYNIFYLEQYNLICSQIWQCTGTRMSEICIKIHRKFLNNYPSNFWGKNNKIEKITSR